MEYMEWKVVYFNINEQKIRSFNLFQHWRFIEDISKNLNKFLKGDLRYYFWSKAEWELVIEITEDNRVILIPWCGCKDKEAAKVDVTNDTSFDWRAFAEKHIKMQIFKNEAKIDVFDQIEFIWDDFVDYCWDNKKELKKKK